jgi:outer membrane protein assembly factor BamE (lipoprotein component of BamABCDE complex)
MKKLLAALFALCAISQPAKSNDWKRLTQSWMEEGQIIQPELVKMVTLGMGKDQVYRLLGAPHFNEAIGAQTWTYTFHLRTAGRSDVKNCLYKIHYERRRIDSIKWKDEACAKAVNG